MLELTEEERENVKLIDRALPKWKGAEISSMLDAYMYAKDLEILALKLIKRQSRQRKELRRLNEDTQYVKALADQNRYLSGEVKRLEKLLGTFATSTFVNERRDTEISGLADEQDEITAVETPVALKSVRPEPVGDIAYQEWDMKTRYPNLPKRDIIVY